MLKSITLPCNKRLSKRNCLFVVVVVYLPRMTLLGRIITCVPPSNSIDNVGKGTLLSLLFFCVALSGPLPVKEFMLANDM